AEHGHHAAGGGGRISHLRLRLRGRALQEVLLQRVAHGARGGGAAAGARTRARSGGGGRARHGREGTRRAAARQRAPSLGRHRGLRGHALPPAAGRPRRRRRRPCKGHPRRRLNVKSRRRMSQTRYAGPIREAAVHPHALVEQGFATDEMLAAVLDRYPAELFDINLYDYDEAGQVSLRAGARGRLDGAELLAAIQQGRLWVNLREVETGWPELWAAAMAEFRAIARATPGLKAI